MLQQHVALDVELADGVEAAGVCEEAFVIAKFGAAHVERVRDVLLFVRGRLGERGDHLILILGAPAVGDGTRVRAAEDIDGDDVSQR